jgi:hypothetical protein
MQDAINSFSLEELQGLVQAKRQTERLTTQRDNLEKQLGAVTREIEKLHEQVHAGKWERMSLPAGRTKSPKAKAQTSTRRSPGRPPNKKRPKRVVNQQSLLGEVQDILRRRKRAMTLTEIRDVIVKEKKYKSRARDLVRSLNSTCYGVKGREVLDRAAPGRFVLRG